MDLHPDPKRGASHESMFAHLSGPFTGGAVETKLTIDSGGEASVDWNPRLPLLLVAPRQTVGDQELSCTVVIVQSSGETVAPVVVTFAPHTEAGSSVLAYRPGSVSMTLDRAAPFDIRLDPAGGGDPATMRDLFELRLIEGNLARLLYVMGAEKMRLRRQAAEIYAARRLAAATGHALDRIGADLRVPRFDARLSWDPNDGVPSIVPHAEEDAAYRERLALYRPFLRPNREAVVERAGAGVVIDEPDTELLVAIRLVSSPGDTRRAAYLAHLRESFLLQPGVDVPSVRLMEQDAEDEENELRHRLAAHFEFPAGAHIAPLLARALDRVGDCRAALGISGRWRVLRAQDDAGGSRYELGLGVDLERPSAAELNTMVANHAAGTINARTPEIAAFVAQLQPVLAAGDPLGRWLLAPCGITTIHPVDATRTYVSHLVVHGLVIGKSVASGQTFLEARWHAPMDSGPDAVLVLALAEADAARAIEGIPPWTLLTGTAERDAWDLAAMPPAPLVDSVTEARIHMLNVPGEIDAAADALPEVHNELVATLQLDAGMTAALIARDPTAVRSLLHLVIAFQRAGMVSLLPLYTSDGRLLLVAGMTPLPGNATLLTARWKSSFRWYLVPLDGQAGTLDRKVGSRNEWRPAAGLAAIVVVAAGKKGSADPRGRVAPFELRVSLPDGDLIDLERYEFLMNLFEHAHPLGVIVDTRGIRGRIDADGDGLAEPLSPSLSRTFRPYRQPRRAGLTGEDEA